MKFHEFLHVSKAKAITYHIRQVRKVSTRGYSAYNYWLKILAQESISSDPDVYFY